VYVSSANAPQQKPAQNGQRNGLKYDSPKFPTAHAQHISSSHTFIYVEYLNEGAAAITLRDWYFMETATNCPEIWSIVLSQMYYWLDMWKSSVTAAYDLKF
jgi:hypothetical protein